MAAPRESINKLFLLKPMNTDKDTTLFERLSIYFLFMGIAFWAFGSLSFFISKPVFKSLQYGWFFFPVLVCLLLGRFEPKTFENKLWIITEENYKRLIIPFLFVLSSTHALGAYLKHLSFQTHMDLAIYGNACKNYLFSTMKGDVWLLADHFEPTLLLFSPLCQLWDPALVLLTAQALILGLGSYGVYRFCEASGFGVKLSSLISFLYLQGYVTTVPIYYDFHLITLSLGILPWLFYSLKTEQWAFFWVMVPFYLGLKENTSLTLAFLGASLLFSSKKYYKIHGALLFTLCVISFGLIMQIVYPYFRNGQPSMYFHKYYSHLGSNLWEICLAPLINPVAFFGSFLTLRKVEYFLHLFVPFLFLPLLDLKRAIVLIPSLFINLASNDRNITGRTSHYEAEAYPLLLLLTVLFLADRRDSKKFTRTVTVWLLFIFCFWGGRSLGWSIVRWWPSRAHTYLHKQLLAQIPESSIKVCAPQKLAAHLTRTSKLYMMDYLGSEDDWKKADRILIAYPDEWMGYFSASEIEKGFVDSFFQGYSLSYQDPVDKTFRIWKREKGSFTPDLKPE